jgi:superfamily II DNA or RNA helicase
MYSKTQWLKNSSYRTGTENEPLEFYLNALSQGNKLDLLLGYFSTSAIHILSSGFAKFLANGGVVRMVINDILSSEDKNAVQLGKNKEIDLNLFNIEDIKSIKDSLDKYSKHFFDCIAWLIANDRIQIIIVKPKNRNGIAHFKSGVFTSGDESIYFKASSNFTSNALTQNLEEVDIACSWQGQDEMVKINNQTTYFELIFNGNADFVDYVDPKDIRAAIATEFGGNDIDDLLISEQNLIKNKFKLYTLPKLKSILDQVNEDIGKFKYTPKFPFPAGPRSYQKEAYLNWVNNQHKGIFAMATGTGKTLTALNCVLEEYKLTGTYNVIILVPTKVLVEQWEKEVKAFNFSNVLKISSKNPGWQTELNALKVKSLFGGSSSICIISTYASFTSPKLQDYIQTAPMNTILIADEAHNLGSPSVLKVLDQIKIVKRIGLSATPKRIYDVEGSAVMEAFFNDSEPYTYNFSMERAINEDILTKYYYFPSIVELNELEMEEYSDITKQLVQAHRRSEVDPVAKKNYEMLLMKRKAIIHKSKNKLTVFESIIEKLGNEGLKYLLVYAPEGYYGDIEELTEEFQELNADNRIIDYYSNVIRRVSPKTTVTQYTSQSDNKEYVLQSFTNGKIDVLLSMKCLDEGVDIPRTEKAIFCSSTGNPRQFIQRRGRILRKHPDKRFSVVYDLVVVPKVAINSQGFELERNLVRKELERVVHFAFLALNKYEAMEALRDICGYYELNLETMHEELM